MTKANAQYALAGVAVIAALLQNIFGTPSPVLDSILTTIITATVWGGYQRTKGQKEGQEK